jgi:hypothetical protein
MNTKHKGISGKYNSFSRAIQFMYYFCETHLTLSAWINTSDSLNIFCTSEIESIMGCPTMYCNKTTTVRDSMPICQVFLSMATSYFPG